MQNTYLAPSEMSHAFVVFFFISEGSQAKMLQRNWVTTTPGALDVGNIV